jgi:hypothetical protein
MTRDAPRRRWPIGRLAPLRALPWAGPGFTAAEVRRLLPAPPGDPRAEAVRRCVARPQDWLPPRPDVVRCPPRYHERLTRIVFWYARGETLPAIERRLGGWHARVDQAVGPPSSGWGLGRAFGAACEGIAGCLNRRPQDYGL